MTLHHQWAKALTLSASLIFCLTSQAQPTHVAAATITDHTCREIAARSNQSPDGLFPLQLQGKTVTLYCHDMAGEPREYLNLPEGNCSEYTSLTQGLRRVQTCFQLVRLDPETLRVDIGDLTFSQTHLLGVITHGKQTVRAMPYATAMSCDAPQFPAGKASITLTGTDFEVVDTFKAQGYRATGDVYPDDRKQRLTLRGGGYCGWMAPGDVYNPIYTADWNPLKNSSGFLLQLRMVMNGEAQ